MTETTLESSGVQELINRLRDEGIQAGRQEAGRLLTEARQQAEALVAQAQADAERIRAQAQEAVAREQDSAREALKLAGRDALLQVRADLAERFQRLVTHKVALELADRQFLRQLVLTVAADSLPEDAAGKGAELVIDRDWFSRTEQRAGHFEKDEQPLRHLLLGATGELMREGFELEFGEDGGRPGLRVRLAGEALEVDLTDEGIAGLLNKHLLPRFRALFDGQYRLRAHD
jgi:V/A-type H+/Na+-transporting ATPase subunit E